MAVKYNWKAIVAGKRVLSCSYCLCLYNHICIRWRACTPQVSATLLPTEVGQFELALVVDEQVLRLQVSVEDFPLVAVGQTAQQLEHEDLWEEKKESYED